MTFVRRGSKDSIGSVAESTNDFALPNQSVIIFDWDDTLCPTHWIQAQFTSFSGPAPDEEWALKPLKDLEVEVAKLLEISMRLAKVVIVTNANVGWVETSCRNFLPGLLPIVEDIDVVYARSVYHEDFEMDYRRDFCFTPEPQLWKEKAFHVTLHNLYSEYEEQSWKNVVCIGDSVFEQEAVRSVVAQRPHTERRCHLKTTKLMDSPTIQQLISQVSSIRDALPKIVEHDGQLDIEISEEDIQQDHIESTVANDKVDRSWTKLNAASLLLKYTQYARLLFSCLPGL